MLRKTSDLNLLIIVLFLQLSSFAAKTGSQLFRAQSSFPQLTIQENDTGNITDGNTQLDNAQDLKDNGRQLKCYDFNHVKCRSSVENCTKFAYCSPDSQDHETYCFSVIPVVKGVMKEREAIKGCFSQPANGAKYCHHSECRATSRGKKEALFCCCTADLCNGEMINIENATNPTEPAPAFEVEVVSSIIERPHVICGFAGIMLTSLMILTCWWYFIIRIRAKRKAGAGVNSAGSADDAERLLIMGNSQESLNVTDLKPIGRGRFGEVCLGTIGGSSVAVKVFSKAELNSWKTERTVYCLPGVQEHENILRYIGSEVHNDSFWIVVEYQQRGSLYHHLKDNTLTLQEALKIITSILSGLSFLHEEKLLNNGLRKRCIVHRDFKSRNVLLKNDLTAVIADFGLAMICENGRSPAEGTRGQVGTKRYMSPEVLEGATEFSAFAFRQIDVYAAALVLWEIISRAVFDSNDKADNYRQPYEDLLGEDPSINDLRLAVVRDKQRPRIRKSIFYTKVGCGLWKTVEEMWNTEPDGRITAGCALERVKRLSTSTAIENQAFNTSSADEVALSSMYNVRGDDSVMPKNVMNDLDFRQMYAPPNQRLEGLPNILGNLYPIISNGYDQSNVINSVGHAKVQQVLPRLR